MAQQKKKTSFPDLPGELRNEIYTLAFNGPTTTTRVITGAMITGLLSMESPARREALEEGLEGARRLVLADFKPKVRGDNREVAAALVPLLITLEEMRWNLRAARGYQHLANQVAQGLARGGSWRFVHR